MVTEALLEVLICWALRFLLSLSAAAATSATVLVALGEAERVGAGAVDLKLLKKPLLRAPREGMFSECSSK